MLSREQKIVMSIVLGTFSAVGCVCLYGFTIGGEFACVKYLIYSAFTSFILTTLAFVFIYKKENFKSIFKKEAFYIALVAVFAVQTLLYQPLNLLSAPEDGREYEVEITQWDFYGRGELLVYFIDDDGEEREVIVEGKIVIADEDEVVLWISDGGRMIIRDTLGGFGLKHAKFIRVTYDPSVEEE